MNKLLIAIALSSIVLSTIASANTETAELKKIIEQQQKTLKNLEKRLAVTEHKVEVTADQIEQTPSSRVNTNNADLSYSHGKNDGQLATTLGGYGELHYNNYEDVDAKIDFHRFVLFVGHEFSSSVRFFSEIELEHGISGDGKNGEVELEQAFIEIDLNKNLTSTVGLFLIPIGIINETHEPPAFYGVERNLVEKNIIPATWWEAGAAINFKPIGGLSIDTAITSGLNVDESYSIRSGRQKASKASAENLAYTARIKYTAIHGLELSATFQYQTDITQSKGDVDTADASLIEVHAIYQINHFSIRGLYARWDINGDEAKVLGRNKQVGWYIEPSYKFSDRVGTFARYTEYDNSAGNNDKTLVNSINVGVNYYLHEDVVLKADYEILDGARNNKGFNLGLGYQF